MTAPQDAHSFARPAEARVTHVALDLAVDFDARRLAGRATLDLAVAPGATAVVLDTNALAVRSVTDDGGRPLPFALGAADPLLGRALTVTLPPGVARVVVEYATAPEAAALQWMAPAQTVGGAHPFLFSQGHAILTRSWIPTQDTPGVRQTFAARVTVPNGLTAVMGAEALTPGGVDAGGARRFDFRMPQPVPAYLIALAVGELAFRPTGRRTGVYAEPALADRAADEFADLERMMAAAEAIAGPYRWDRFDVLVMPPSFPFGGMENPRLAFVSPSLIAGDRSLTTVVAHELAHAWAGNLVTHATWSDFWLNEGFTVYMELRINEALHGPERAAMLDVYGRLALDEEIRSLGPTSPDTRLHAEFADRDPAVGVTAIPYIKGALFLRAIEEAVGRERFDRYLRGWFDGHAFAAVTTGTFLWDLRARLLGDDAELERRIGVDGWVFEPGLPAGAPRAASAALDAAAAAAQAVAAGAPASSVDAARWSPQEWRHFLGALPRELPARTLDDLDRRFALSAAGNSEILFAWLRLALRNRYAPALPAAERFLAAQGRRKFLKPLYEELMATDWGRATARRVYARARPTYHATVTASLDPIVR